MRLQHTLGRTPYYVFGGGLAVIFLFPLVWTVVASVSPHPATAQQVGVGLGNYRTLMNYDSGLPTYLWNSTYVSILTVVFTLVLSVLGGYAFARFRFPGRDAIFLVIVGLLVVPIQLALIPLARLFGELGLFGTIPGVILFHAGFGLPFAIFLLRNFFAAIPRDLLEAARMDGGRELTIFRRVILPLGGPAIASLAIFQFLWVWNDLLVALIFADPTVAPLTAAIQRQTRNFGQNVDVIAPGAFLQMLVPLLVFFAFQRYFIEGISASGVKE